MPLPSFLKRFRAQQADDLVASAATPSEEARTRARRRLIGAAVLVVAGVIGFPLLFDSPPRPLPSDLPIVMPHKDGGHEVDAPHVATATGGHRVDEPAAAAHPVPDEEAPASASTMPKREPASAESGKSEPPKAELTKPEAVKSEPSKPAAKTPAKPNPAEKSDTARAQALLNGQDAAKPSAGAARAASAVEVRYIVQIGAFADVPKAHEARVKVEKLGLKTYTQVVNGDGGKRIRVRVGPFPDKDAAEKAAGKIRQAGMTAAILTL
jgi:DedD protein